MIRIAIGTGFLAALLSVVPAFADDWTASQLRGQVQQLVANQWQPVNRGDVIPDTRPIRTLAIGHVTLVRGGETIELGPNTQIQIHDRAGAKPFTTVSQAFGNIRVEANVENVQHFAVDTPYLAAVVKGTKFLVTSGKTGSSVSVQRGHVEVDDQHTGSHVTIAVGQAATIDTVKTSGEIEVSGAGKLPVVLDRQGQPMAATATDGQATKNAAKSADKAAKDAAKQAADLQKKADKLGSKDAKDAAKAAQKEADATAKAARKAEADAAKTEDKGKGLDNGVGPRGIGPSADKPSKGDDGPGNSSPKGGGKHDSGPAGPGGAGDNPGPAPNGDGGKGTTANGGGNGSPGNEGGHGKGK